MRAKRRSTEHHCAFRAIFLGKHGQSAACLMVHASDPLRDPLHDPFRDRLDDLLNDAFIGSMRANAHA